MLYGENWNTGTCIDSVYQSRQKVVSSLGVVVNGAISLSRCLEVLRRVKAPALDPGRPSHIR
jgi:hypothetical protein